MPSECHSSHPSLGRVTHPSPTLREKERAKLSNDLMTISFCFCLGVTGQTLPATDNYTKLPQVSLINVCYVIRGIPGL